MKKKFTIIIAVTCFLAISFFCWRYISLESFSDEGELADYISREENIEKVDIKETKVQDGFLAVYYNNGTKDKLIILEEDKIFSNRYKYFGGSSSSSEFNTFNFGQSSTWALIVVYGNNKELKANSYEFVNNGNTYTSEELGDYVLDIYKINETSDISSNGHLYDKNGKVICQL
ncbi:hypothetical protein SH2C18_35760 [Clostridium sediminicola]|uniref:hypothetical protein n=1 Tax=Clostridium sediminicola TaxID=3114879 RepID=UPI0031F263B3